MVEIVTQAGNDERETLDFTKDFPPLRSLKGKKSNYIGYISSNEKFEIYMIQS